jgi:hypothetical protein
VKGEIHQSHNGKNSGAGSAIKFNLCFELDTEVQIISGVDIFHLLSFFLHTIPLFPIFIFSFGAILRLLKKVQQL